MVSPFRSFEAEVFDFASRNHISSVCTTTRMEGEPYSVGEEFAAGDFAIYKNNSKRTRKCIVREVQKLSPKKYNIYIEPTKEDASFKRLDLGPINEDI